MDERLANPQESLVRAIGSSGGFDLLVEAGDLTLDGVLEEGIFRDVPVVGNLVRLYKVGAGVRDYLFLRKVIRFLTALKDVPQPERDAFVEEMERDSATKRRVGEALLLHLEKADDLEKCSLLARVFKAYLRKRIDLVSFRRLAAVIDRCLIKDLNDLLNYTYEYEFLDTIVTQGLSTAGLLQLSTTAPSGDRGPSDRWEPTALGDLFISVVGHV